MQRGIGWRGAGGIIAVRHRPTLWAVKREPFVNLLESCDSPRAAWAAAAAAVLAPYENSFTHELNNQEIKNNWHEENRQ